MTDLYPTLRKDSRAPEATAVLTKMLARRGYAVDTRCSLNRVGASIVHAIKRFQAQHLDLDGHPLVVDGIAGPKTWAALLRPLGDLQCTGLGAAPPSDDRIPCDPRSAVGRFLAACLAHYDDGVVEVPLGSNCVPELETRAQGLPWCSFWVHDRIKIVRGSFIFGGRRGSTRVDLRIAASEGRIVPDFKERPGDVWILCDEDGRPYHTGVVLRPGNMDSVVGPTEMDTVEGNCANRAAVRRREITDQIVFWRPFPGPLDWKPGLLPGSVKRAGGESTR